MKTPLDIATKIDPTLKFLSAVGESTQNTTSGFLPKKTDDTRTWDR